MFQIDIRMTVNNVMSCEILSLYPVYSKEKQRISLKEKEIRARIEGRVREFHTFT